MNTRANENILPCPKCDHIYIYSTCDMSDPLRTPILQCGKCKYTRGGVKTIEGLIDLWNTESFNSRNNKPKKRIYIPFGDWANDDHGRYEKVIVLARSEENLWQAVDNIKEKYGQYIFEGLANQYQDSSISEDIYKILIDNQYDFSKIPELEDIPEDREEYYKPYEEHVKNSSALPLKTIQDIYFFLLRLGGAIFEISQEEIPLFTYESVGYGCFYD